MFELDPFYTKSCELVDLVLDFLEKSDIYSTNYEIWTKADAFTDQYIEFSWTQRNTKGFKKYFTNFIKKFNEFSNTAGLELAKETALDLESMVKKFNDDSWKIYHISKIINQIEMNIRFADLSDLPEELEELVKERRVAFKVDLSQIVNLRNSVFNEGVTLASKKKLCEVLDHTIQNIKLLEDSYGKFLDKAVFEEFSILKKPIGELRSFYEDIEVELILNPYEKSF